MPPSSAYQATFEKSGKAYAASPYQKGLEFNARIKYDYNIVNNMQGSPGPTSFRQQSAIQQVANQMLSK